MPTPTLSDFSRPYAVFGCRPQNYRPVCNLPFLFKILGRIVFSRLTDYFLANNLLDPFQSAYIAHHSVETLLLNVSNFILQEMDRGNVTAMILGLISGILFYFIYHKPSSPHYKGFKMRQHVSLHWPRNTLTSPPF